MSKFGERYVERVERNADERTNLRAGQHILHLLLTIFTCGLWLPVWIIRAHRGNPRPYKDDVYRRESPPQQTYTPAGVDYPPCGTCGRPYAEHIGGQCP